MRKGRRDSIYNEFVEQYHTGVIPVWTEGDNCQNIKLLASKFKVW